MKRWFVKLNLTIGDIDGPGSITSGCSQTVFAESPEEALVLAAFREAAMFAGTAVALAAHPTVEEVN